MGVTPVCSRNKRKETVALFMENASFFIYKWKSSYVSGRSSSIASLGKSILISQVEVTRISFSPHCSLSRLLWTHLWHCHSYHLKSLWLPSGPQSHSSAGLSFLSKSLMSRIEPGIESVISKGWFLEYWTVTQHPVRASLVILIRNWQQFIDQCQALCWVLSTLLILTSFTVDMCSKYHYFIL